MSQWGMGALGQFRSAMDDYFDALADRYWSGSPPCRDCEGETDGRCKACWSPLCERCANAEGFCATCARDAEAASEDLDDEEEAKHPEPCAWCGAAATWRCAHCDDPICPECRHASAVCPECRWDRGDLSTADTAIAEAVMPVWMMMARADEEVAR